jgi:hypothetical protein
MRKFYENTVSNADHYTVDDYNRVGGIINHDGTLEITAHYWAVCRNISRYSYTGTHIGADNLYSDRYAIYFCP